MKAELESAEYKQKLQVVTSKYGQAQKELQVRRPLPAESWNWVRLISASVKSSGIVSKSASYRDLWESFLLNS